MTKNISMLSLTLAAVGLMASCAAEHHDMEEEVTGTGLVNVVLKADTQFTPIGRALSENNYKNTANYIVKVTNAIQGNVVAQCMGSEVNRFFPKALSIGSYRIEASYGTESAASRSDFRVVGETVVNLKGNDQVEATVACAPTCGKLSVDFDKDMDRFFKDYKVTYTGTEALAGKTIEWAKGDSEPWYISLNDKGEDIAYTITLTTKDEYMQQVSGKEPQATAEVKGSFRLARNKAHRLVVKPNYNPNVETGMTLTITIDDSTNDRPVTWEVPVTWI